MRTARSTSATSAGMAGQLNENLASPASAQGMTSRGAKYWDSGTIPLIAPDILGNIISEVADVGIVINNDGTVLSVLVNPNYEMFRKLEHLEGRSVRDALTTESCAKFDDRLTAFLTGDGNTRPLELNHRVKATRMEFPVRYSFHQIGPDGAILMLGRDLRPVAEMQQQLVQAQISLERDYEAQREFETRFRVLMENTTDAMMLVSLQTGRVVDTNSRAANLCGTERSKAIDSDFVSLLESRKRGDLLDRLNSHAMSGSEAPFQARLMHGPLDVVLHATAFRVSGERLLMCRIQPADSPEASIDPLDGYLRQLYVGAPDAMVFTKEDGTILSANDGFHEFLGMAHDNGVKGENLGDYLLRGSVDLKVMTENAGRAGKMRLYATKVAGQYGSPRNVEISVTSFAAGESTLFAFLMREATRGDVPARAPTDDGMQSVIDLVGSATLKDIVSETTNVVERMCIETAVELTMNNRVAAAEMLGLSRQSLYVKLRKFGILSRDKPGEV